MRSAPLVQSGATAEAGVNWWTIELAVALRQSLCTNRRRFHGWMSSWFELSTERSTGRQAFLPDALRYRPGSEVAARARLISAMVNPISSMKYGLIDGRGERWVVRLAP
jgi:hypothetical protein